MVSGSRACPCGRQDSDKGSRQCTAGAVLQSGQAWVSAECSVFWQGGLEQICAGVLNCRCHCVCYCTYHSPAAQLRGDSAESWALSAESGNSRVRKQGFHITPPPSEQLLTPFILMHLPMQPPTPPSLCCPLSCSFVTNSGWGTQGEAAITSINLSSCCWVFDSNERGRRDGRG